MKDILATLAPVREATKRIIGRIQVVRVPAYAVRAGHAMCAVFVAAIGRLPRRGTRGWYGLLLAVGILCGVAAKAVAWEYLVIGFDDYRIVTPPGTMDLTSIVPDDASRR